MTRPMYETPKPRKNAKKVIENPIAKRKKVVLNFVQREEIIDKSKRGFCCKKIALDYKVGLATVYDIIAKGPVELMKFRQENPDSKIKCTFKTSAYPLVDKALKLWFYQIRNDNVQINYDTVACQAMVFQKDLYTCTINFIYNKVLEKQKHVIRKIYHPKDFKKKSILIPDNRVSTV